MTLRSSQSVLLAGTTPTAITPTATDTIDAGSFGPLGVFVRVITTGTATNVTVVDPGATPQSNPGTVTPVACPATGVRMILVPPTALNPATGTAGINFSSITGATYELYRA